MTANSTNVRINGSIVISHVQPDNASHDEVAEDETHERVQKHVMAGRGRDHWLEVLRVQKEIDQPDENRKRGEHPSGKPPLRRHRANVARHLEALADRVADVLDDLGEIAAALVGDQDADYEDGEIGIGD